MTSIDQDPRAACAALTRAYGHHADAGQPDQLAALFTADGVFDRLGTRIVGHQDIRDFIANRPRDSWQIHRGSNFTFELAADGCTATGTLDLELLRGKLGETTASEIIQARYHDRFVLTDAGWKFAQRSVRLIEPAR